MLPCAAAHTARLKHVNVCACPRQRARVHASPCALSLGLPLPSSAHASLTRLAAADVPSLFLTLEGVVQQYGRRHKLVNDLLAGMQAAARNEQELQQALR